MAQLSLRLFGAPQVDCDGEPISLRFHKELALLIYLAGTHRPHTRLALATLFWPEQDQQSALAALRRTLYQIKVDLGEGILDVTRRTVRLSDEVELQVDTRTFLEAAHVCRGHAHPPQAPFASCVALLESAVRLYVDDFLAGFSLPDSPMFDEWQFFEREGLRAECLRILAMLTAYYERQQDYDHAIEMARRWLSREPYHEPAHRVLIRLYTLIGQPEAAARQYDLCKRLLSEELGMSPHLETERLYQAIKDRSSDLTVRPDTHYTQSGTRYLAYQTIGAGAVDLLVVGGFISHLEQLWEESDLAGFLQQLSTVARVLLYDKCGVGLSDRVGTAPSLECQVGDALAIIHAARSPHVVILAVSDGAATAIQLAVQHPEHIAGLVIYGGQAKGVRSAEYPWGLTPTQYQRWMEKLVKGWGEPINLEYFAPSRAHDQRLRQWWAQTQRLAASPGAVQGILEGIRDADVRPLLHQIRVPTLILHRRGDRCVRVESGRYLARHIPHARYVELPGDDHWWWVGDTHLLHEEIERFIDQQHSAPRQTTSP
jgi:DNA-binding SARP family transcriptional activator/pimeloyl-ACP methyl ester carboxylesterase